MNEKMALADRYRRWFEYEKDSHTKVIESLQNVPQEKSSEPGFQKALNLLAHIVAARRLWLFRLGASKEAPGLSEFSPQETTIEETKKKVENMQQAWTAYLQGVSDSELTRSVKYQSLEGEWFENTVEDTLTQVFGHSWYHRGQIASLVKSLDVEPAPTDFIFWCRNPIEEFRQS